jgi:hypothetical protein
MLVSGRQTRRSVCDLFGAEMNTGRAGLRSDCGVGGCLQQCSHLQQQPLINGRSAAWGHIRPLRQRRE